MENKENLKIERITIGHMVKSVMASNFFVGIITTIVGITLIITSFLLLTLSGGNSTKELMGIIFNIPNISIFILILGVLYVLIGGIIWLLLWVLKKH